MTDASLAPSDFDPPLPAAELAPRFMLRTALAIGAVVFGDFLFFHRPVGISFPLFIAALAAALLIAARPPVRTSLIASAALGFAVLPLIEDVSLLSVSIAIAALVLFAAFIAAGEARCAELLRSAVALLAIGPFQYLPDLARARREGRLGVRRADLRGWLLPLGCGVVFLVLFGAANPLIGKWLEAFAPWQWLRYVDFGRVVLWLLLLMTAWPIILPRVRNRWRFFATGFEVGGFRETGLVAALFTPASILRSLVLFNLLFAVQTGMDIAYLWGGVELPDGMTYAAYAHRGAYPLILTALLAGGFVLIAMPARTMPQPIVRALVLAFILQNVMLVISSMLRLDLYIETYSLTLLRVTAFIWMGLVAFGLALILVRIVLGRSNTWLIGANLTALIAALYVCAFSDIPAMIASYNVTRHIEHDAIIDRVYLNSLGPSALPAIDRLRARDWAISNSGREYQLLPHPRNDMAAEHRAQMENWRGWTLRGQRLLNYLEAQASAKPQPKEADSKAGAPT